MKFGLKSLFALLTVVAVFLGGVMFDRAFISQDAARARCEFLGWTNHYIKLCDESMDECNCRLLEMKAMSESDYIEFEKRLATLQKNQATLLKGEMQ